MHICIHILSLMILVLLSGHLMCENDRKSMFRVLQLGLQLNLVLNKKLQIKDIWYLEH